MSTPQNRSGGESPPRLSQGFWGGLVLCGLAGLALYLSRDLAQGTLTAMGPAMLPRWLAIGVGLAGLALLVAGLLKPGTPLEPLSLRGPAFIILAILAFALTIRSFAIAGLSTPSLGLIISGPLAIIIGGYASPEARLRQLVILALALTPFCMILFGDLLNLAIPVFPQALMGLFPAGWSQKAVLRLTAAILAGAAVLVYLATRRRTPGPTPSGPVDVADHSGRI